MTNEVMTIRAFQAADTSRLSDIWYRASLRAHPFLGRQRLSEQRKLIETVYLPKAETWVACLENRPVGFIGLLDAFIGGLFVDPDRHRGGIGRALVAHALGLKGELTVEVYAANAGACAFYRRQGFTETARRPQDDNGLPFELVCMRLFA